MKLKLSLFLLLLTGLTFNTYAQTYTIGTYNVRYANPRDSGNLWVNRLPVITALINFHRFDIFGTQEALPNQIKDMENAFLEYQRYGHGRDDGQEAGEHSAIFFRKDKFKLLNQGDFWLSQTPEKPSLGWDSTCCNRICSWVYLQDVKSKKKFYFFNVHYDHEGVVAREESSKLILQRIAAIAGKEPVF